MCWENSFDMVNHAKLGDSPISKIYLYCKSKILRSKNVYIYCHLKLQEWHVCYIYGLQGVRIEAKIIPKNWLALNISIFGFRHFMRINNLLSCSMIRFLAIIFGINGIHWPAWGKSSCEVLISNLAAFPSRSIFINHC